MRSVLFCLAALLLLCPVVSAQEVNLTILGLGNYSAGQDITGTLEISHSKYISRDASLRAYIDGELVSTIPLQGYLKEPGYYQFKAQTFSYNLSANGQNTWDSYPTITFGYTVHAEGTCGGEYCCGGESCWCQCPCGDVNDTGSFPCDWSDSLPLSESPERSISGKPGGWLKEIGANLIEPPRHSNNDTVWSVSGVTDARVEVTMRAACGYQDYGGSLASNGWRYGSLEGGTQVLSDRIFQILPFELKSLDFGYTRYGGGPGGIFKNGVYQNYTTNALWWANGTIIIKDFDPDAEYTINFLPPNGPKACAYTSHKISDSSAWTKSVSVEGASTYYNSPYNESQDVLIELLGPPDCPSGTYNCVKTVVSHTAVETEDPSGTVTLTFDPAAKTVTATTTSLSLARAYLETLNLSTFLLKAPEQVGSHILGLKIYYQGVVEGEGSGSFNTCLDQDGDGYCPETGDCNDANSLMHPGARESCNGVDDDCDGDIDEDFWAAGSKLGSPCGVGVCEGYWVCTPDGVNVTCSQKYLPGQFREICENELDDDCDGVTDEEFELANGQPVQACWCEEGSTKPCGSNVGACRQGYRICSNYQWSECIDEIAPAPETCNRADEDCDGIVDNVGGGTSIQATRCGCYDNAAPSDETCNDIDDDCDGQIDEGITCCTPDQTRSCGIDVGACIPGIQTCTGEGTWGPCANGVQPMNEICYDTLDNDCDGLVDEECYPELTCQNGIKDLNEDGIDCGGPCPRVCKIEETPLPFTILAVVGIILIILAGLITIRGRGS